MQHLSDGISPIELKFDGTTVSALNPLPVTGTFTPAALQNVNITQFGSTAVTLGQKAMTASIPVVFASDQTALPVTGTFFQATQPISAVSLPLPTGAATSAKQDTLLTELQLKADLTETQPVSLASVPLPTGAATLAEQQTQTASLSVLDDWDETNRAAVNTIAGQVGVQGGSGTTNALTQRVVLATDVALPTGTNSIGATVPNRPSQGAGRVYKTAHSNFAAAQGSIYTVTAGKTLYVTSIWLTGYNNSAVTVAQWFIRDNGETGTVRAGGYFPAVVGVMTSWAQTFPEPLQFTTDVFYDLASGSLNVGVGFVGYEETT